MFGKNNIIIVDSGLRIKDSLTINIGKNSKVIIGKNFQCGSAIFFINEEPNLIIQIGDDCMFSSAIQLRTSDSHSIYNLNNPNKSLNKAIKGINIGNHCWIGHNVFILKDVTIGNNCVVGMRSLVTRGMYPDNSIYAGSPAKCIKTNIGWSSTNPSLYPVTGSRG